MRSINTTRPVEDSNKSITQKVLEYLGTIESSSDSSSTSNAQKGDSGTTKSSPKSSSRSSSHKSSSSRLSLKSPSEASFKSSNRYFSSMKSSDRSSVKSSATKSSNRNSRGTVPPHAPMPPRLPTPDLSDVEESDFFPSYCGSSKMDQQLAAAKGYQSATRAQGGSTSQYERDNERSRRLEQGCDKKA